MDGDGEDFTSLPLDDKLSHKSWKARQAGYEELNKLLLDPSVSIDRHSEKVAKIPQEANLAALESGLATLQTFAQFHPSAALKLRKSIVSPLLEKCLSSSRVGTRTRAIETLLLIIDADSPGFVVEATLSQINSAKQPKVVAICIAFLCSAISLYGAKTVDIKPIVKELPKMFGHSDSSVRSEASRLAVEIYKWTGAAVFANLLGQLKPVQAKELNDAFQAPFDRPAQQRFLISQQNNNAMVTGEDGEADKAETLEASETAVTEPVDELSFVDPVDILPLIKAEYLNNLASANWKERKEALEEIQKCLNVPKIQENQFNSLINSLAKRVSDVNLLCALIAVNCIENLAKGLGKSFSPYKSIVLSPLLERCKEKKQNVLTAIRAALDAVTKYALLPDVLEATFSAMSNKNPTVRLEAVGYLCRMLVSVRSTPTVTDMKTLVNQLLKTVEDSAQDVREKSMEALAILLKIMGSKETFGFALEKLDAIKTGKVIEFSEGIEISCKPITKISGKPSTMGSTKLLNANRKSEMDITIKKRPASSQASVGAKALKPSKSTPMLKTAQKDKTTESKKPFSRSDSATSVVAEQEKISYEYSDEDAIQKAVELLTDMPSLSDPAWKVRLEAIEDIYNKVSGGLEIPVEVLIRFLRQKSLFKDNNFQVLSQLFQILKHLSTRPDFTKGSVVLCLQPLVDKLGDAKLGKLASEVLESFAENTSFGFVLGNSLELAAQQKSPKALAEYLKMIQDHLQIFGTAGVSVKKLIEFLKSSVSNSNAQVRSAVFGALGQLRVFVGPEISMLLEDLSPQQLSAIQAEYEKVKDADQSAPKKTQKMLNSVRSSRPASAGKSSAMVKPPTLEFDEDLFPSVDISAQMDAGLISNINDANWKIRKEGLDSLSGILAAAKGRIKHSYGELIPALKARLGDSNKNLVIQTLEISAILASSTGSAFERTAKILIPGVASCLNDNKAQVRQAALNTMDKFSEAVTANSLIPQLAIALATDGPNLKKELLGWISTHCNEQDMDLSSMIMPVLESLQDRSADVRKGAQAVVPHLITFCGFPKVRAKCNDLKQQSAQILQFVESCQKADSVRPESSSVQSSIKPQKPIIASSEVASSGAQTSSTMSRPGSRLVLNRKKSIPQQPTSDLVENAANIVSDESSKQFPILVSDSGRGKEKRADQDRGSTKWNLDSAPRKELIDFLREQMTGIFSPALLRLLFSEDHHKEKDHQQALATLIDSFEISPSTDVNEEEIGQRFISQSDMIFKYLTIRFYDSNTSILLKSLDLLEKFISLLDSKGYHVNEYEAACFLPSFLSKVGDNKETIRARVRQIMKQWCRIYPASKMFVYLMKALDSKNSRIRSECLEELGMLIERNGLNVCNPSKSMPMIAVHIADRDASVRNAALNAVANAYVVLGDSIYKYLGNISEKDKSLLEERIKRRKDIGGNSSAPVIRSASASALTKSPSSAAAKVQPVISASNSRKFSLDLENLNLPELSTSADKMQGLVPKRVSDAAKSKDYMMDVLMTQITSGDAYQSIEALKTLEKYIQTQPDIVLSQMNHMVNSITLQVRLAFTSPVLFSPEPATLLRLCKHLVNVLVQMFSNKTLAVELSRDTMHQLLSELLARLIDPALQQNLGEHGSQLVRALNVLMLRILDNCDKNRVFSVLLDLLDNSIIMVDQETSDQRVKYAELVMKCLWKLTKSLKQTLEQGSLDVPDLLGELHKFFMASPPNEWKRRAADKLPLGDMPLRTVKTILHELCVGVGAGIMQHLTNSSIVDPGKSIVGSYLTMMLQSSGSIPADSPIKEPCGSGSQTVAGVAVAKDLTGQELNLAVEHIFKKIESKDQAEEGLKELYEFQKACPKMADLIEEKINGFGLNFRIYIRRSLNKLAEANEDSPSSHSADPPAAHLKTDETAESYKERLNRLQQMFSGSASSLPTNNTQSQSINSSPARVSSVTMQSTTTTTTTTEMAVAMQQPAAGEPSQQPAFPSVDTLKERLARMKSAIGMSDV